MLVSFNEGAEYFFYLIDMIAIFAQVGEVDSFPIRIVYAEERFQ